jgi:hypothetical protein
MLNERFLSILSTKENVNLQTLGFTGDSIHQYQAMSTRSNSQGKDSEPSLCTAHRIRMRLTISFSPNMERP